MINTSKSNGEKKSKRKESHTSDGMPFWRVRDLLIKPQIVIVMPSAVSSLVAQCRLETGVDIKTLVDNLLKYQIKKECSLKTTTFWLQSQTQELKRVQMR